MRNRIRRYADQRTAMLAGVSHDLRTPLTRLRLELSMMPKDVDTGPAREDITEMEGMLDAYLAFARGEEGEQPEETDLLTLASAASEVAARKASLTLHCPTPIRMRVRPLALKRALANLAGNAADYGRNVRITIRREADAALIIVEDDGPGISPAQYEEAFRPFNRLDPARNQNVSGVGLGLTIARDTARAHGGDVILGRSELGGLKASVRLPMSPN
jgi:two-component system osmolarity sensor histidine kinase EnvZ